MVRRPLQVIILQLVLVSNMLYIKKLHRISGVFLLKTKTFHAYANVFAYATSTIENFLRAQ